MGLISSINGLDRDIYLSAETVGATIHPMDLYKEYRAMRRNTESLRKFLPFMVAKGNEAKGGGAFTERYVVLTHGARIVPYNVSHTLTVVGTIINDAGQSGINCFDRTELSSTTYVNINYVPPQVEVIVVTVSGSNVITGSINDIPAAPSASAVAAAVIAGMPTITGALTTEQSTLLTSAATQATIARKMQTNKAVISGDGLSVSLYEDDGTTLLHTFSTPDENTRIPTLLADGGGGSNITGIVGYEADGVTPTGVTYQAVVIDGTLATVEL